MSLTPAHEAQFDAWLEEHRGIVLKVARSFARNATDTTELEQELLLQLWISVPAYAGQAKPSTWIYRVCLNTALTWLRGADRRERRIEPGADATAVAAPTASPADSAGERELLEQLYAAIHAMPIRPGSYPAFTRRPHLSGDLRSDGAFRKPRRRGVDTGAKTSRRTYERNHR
jgi:RNA polymerase sigma factor (sigma-70 family)